METCRLCLSKVESLEDSHIISECFYKNLYDSKHRVVPITTDLGQQLDFVQKGYREKLLCKTCETRFSKWEGVVYRDLKSIGAGESRFLKIRENNGESIHVSGLRYNEFKRGLLSIFWRMAVSSIPMFKEYKFGPYSEKLRTLLLGDARIPTLQYPIYIRICFLGNEFTPALMMMYPRRRHLGICSFYKLVLNGFAIAIFLSEMDFPVQTEKWFLHEDGSIAIRKVHIEKWRENGVFDRLDDSDVEDKMRKLIEK